LWHAAAATAAAWAAATALAAAAAAAALAAATRLPMERRADMGRGKGGIFWAMGWSKHSIPTGLSIIKTTYGEQHSCDKLWTALLHKCYLENKQVDLYQFQVSHSFLPSFSDEMPLVLKSNWSAVNNLKVQSAL
jgi:hypothetical protein